MILAGDLGLRHRTRLTVHLRSVLGFWIGRKSVEKPATSARLHPTLPVPDEASRGRVPPIETEVDYSGVSSHKPANLVTVQRYVTSTDDL